MSHGRSMTLLSLHRSDADVSAHLTALLAATRFFGVLTQVVTSINGFDLMKLETQHAHVLLIDDLDRSTQTTLRLISRMSKTGIGIMVVIKNHVQRLQALEAGAHICLRLPVIEQAFLADTLDLLAHCERGELRRLATHSSGHSISVPTQTTEIPLWRLLSHEWLLAAPNGRMIALTRRERFFLSTLFNSDDRSLTFERWVYLSDVICPLNKNSHHAFSIIVSRLRRKCLAHGCAFPLTTDWGYGYVFTEACAIEHTTLASHPSPTNSLLDGV